MAGEHEADDGRILRAQRAQQRDAVGIGHAHIDKGDVRQLRAGAQIRQRFAAAVGFVRNAQPQLRPVCEGIKRIERKKIVIYEQNLFHSVRSFTWGSVI